MKRNIQSLPLDLITLDQENVRFGGDVAQNQREAIELIMADPDDAKKLLKLAEHIAEHGLDPTELQLVTPDNNGGYIVLEGNRRLAALKLLQKPDLCPDEKLVKDFFKAYEKTNGRLPLEIDCSVVSSRTEGDIWVELKHTGQNGGVGRVGWDSNIRDERRARQTGIESIGRQVRNIAQNNPEIFSPDTIRDIFNIPVTTLTRLFSSKPAQETFQLKIVNKQLKPQVGLTAIAPSVEFAINLFTNEDYNVNDIRNSDDRQRFIHHIPAELHPLFIQKTAKVNSRALQFEPKKNVNDTTHSSDTPETIDALEALEAIEALEALEPVQSNTMKPDTSMVSEKKTRANPASHARKYLLPWSLSISNTRINAIYRELRSLIEVDKCPNAVAITFRVFIEVTCDDYTSKHKKLGTPLFRFDNGKALSEDDKLSTKLRSVVKHLEETGKLGKQEARAINNRANSKEIIGSIDHFNQFVHSSASAPLPSELKSIADEYRPMFESIWR